ncbi:senescence regulator [Perilla frutescens var. hirtella]|nr:senescence regulator [Perilla frutescens var. frutescens]KAH6775981.1 senescence regulator [Perilla frutescens var. hirtella]
MAKGRKLTTSRSEMFLGSFGYHHGGGAVNGASELGEDEVWSTVDEAVNEENHSGGGEWSSRAASVSSGSYGGGGYVSRHPAAHASQRQVGGLSLAFDDSTSSPSIVHQIRAQDSMVESPRGRHLLATSAPVNVPDWSKIYRVDSVESLHDSDDGLIDDSELIPPHEYLARQYASTRKMAANSVFEGVGRTLKGRDLSRVRDAVWSQTGFDG